MKVSENSNIFSAFSSDVKHVVSTVRNNLLEKSIFTRVKTLAAYALFAGFNMAPLLVHFFLMPLSFKCLLTGILITISVDIFIFMLVDFYFAMNRNDSSNNENEVKIVETPNPVVEIDYEKLKKGTNVDLLNLVQDLP